MPKDFTELSADLKSYPIMGALRGGGVVNIPLISHIHENLYLGGCLDGVELGSYFTHIFSFYDDEKYAFGEGTTYHGYSMRDSVSHAVPEELIYSASEEILLALEEGGNVLVHCQAGINRSSTVAALVLMKWLELRPSEAIMLLSQQRSPVILSNSLFRDWVLAQGT